MNSKLRWYDLFTINIYFTGLTILSQSNLLIFPLLIQQFVGVERQATYLGNLRLWTLMIALLSQALMGMLSDRSSISWGRRRPFILVGTLFDVVLIILIGFTSGFQGERGFWILFILAVLLHISSNTAHGPAQGLIPDLVPEEQRGRFSGFKSFLELPVPLLFVSYSVARFLEAGNLWLAIATVCFALLVVMSITMFVREKPLSEPKKINPESVLRLGAMAGGFTVLILFLGWIIKVITRSLTSSNQLLTHTLVIGFAGITAMLLAVVVGVWVSTRVSLGEQQRDYQSFTWWVINRLSFLVGVINLSTFAIFFFQSRLGMEEETAAGPAAKLMLIVGICILVTAIPGGWLADKFGKKRLVALSCLVAFAGTVIVLSGTNLVLIFIGGSIIGIATGIFYTSNWALGTKLVPKAKAGMFLGISNLAGAGAGAVGAYIGGPIADHFTNVFPENPGYGYVVLFAIYSLMFLVSFVSLVKIKDSK